MDKGMVTPPSYFWEHKIDLEFPAIFPQKDKRCRKKKKIALQLWLGVFLHSLNILLQNVKIIKKKEKKKHVGCLVTRVLYCKSHEAKRSIIIVRFGF